MGDGCRRLRNGRGRTWKGWGTDDARLQIVTVEELLDRQMIDMPAVGQQRATFKRAPKAKGDGPEQLALAE